MVPTRNAHARPKSTATAPFIGAATATAVAGAVLAFAIQPATNLSDDFWRYPYQLEPVYDRLRQIGLVDPTAAEEIVERITRTPTDTRKWSYRDRRKELLLARLDQDADLLDKAADEIGQFFDHLRQVGIRGFIAEHADDDDDTRPGDRPRGGPGGSRREATSRLDDRPPDSHEPGEE